MSLFQSTKQSQTTTVKTGAVNQNVNLALSSPGASVGGEREIYQPPVFDQQYFPGYSGIMGQAPALFGGSSVVPAGYGAGVQPAEWTVQGSNWIPIAVAAVVVIGAVIALKV